MEVNVEVEKTKPMAAHQQSILNCVRTNMEGTTSIEMQVGQGGEGNGIPVPVLTSHGVGISYPKIPRGGELLPSLSPTGIPAGSWNPLPARHKC